MSTRIRDEDGEAFSSRAAHGDEIEAIAANHIGRR
jgi:hypothetical protein